MGDEGEGEGEEETEEGEKQRGGGLGGGGEESRKDVFSDMDEERNRKDSGITG